MDPCIDGCDDTDDVGFYDDEEMTIGIDCCPHYIHYGSDCYQCDAEHADKIMGLTGGN